MQKEVKVNPQEILSSPHSCKLIQPKPTPYKIVLVDDDGKEFFTLLCNWLQRKMFKLLLGFEIKENKE